jgi:hypothetical protein
MTEVDETHVFRTLIEPLKQFQKMLIRCRVVGVSFLDAIDILYGLLSGLKVRISILGGSKASSSWMGHAVDNHGCSRS